MVINGIQIFVIKIGSKDLSLKLILMGIQGFIQMELK